MITLLLQRGLGWPRTRYKQIEGGKLVWSHTWLFLREPSAQKLDLIFPLYLQVFLQSIICLEPSYKFVRCLQSTHIQIMSAFHFVDGQVTWWGKFFLCPNSHAQEHYNPLCPSPTHKKQWFCFLTNCVVSWIKIFGHLGDFSKLKNWLNCQFF